MNLFSKKTGEKPGLQNLAMRVGRATEADRELDAAIWSALIEAEPSLAGEAGKPPTPLTASLDAALALSALVLPDWTWKLNQVDKGTKHYKCTFEPQKGSAARGFSERSAALAVIDALIRACIDRQAA